LRHSVVEKNTQKYTNLNVKPTALTSLSEHNKFALTDHAIQDR